MSQSRLPELPVLRCGDGKNGGDDHDEQVTASTGRVRREAGQSIHVRSHGDRRSPGLQPTESTERPPPPCRSDDLTTVGVCVACATPPVDVSTEVLASARRRHFYLAGDAT